MGECYTSSNKALWEYSTLRVQNNFGKTKY